MGHNHSTKNVRHIKAFDQIPKVNSVTSATLPFMDATIMIERRRHKRVSVEFWASLKHPLLGTITCSIQDMSVSGVLLKLDEDLNFFVMMELDIRIHGDGWDNTMPALPVQVVRVDGKEIALRFMDSIGDTWAPPADDDYDIDDDLAALDDLNLAASYSSTY